MANHKSSLKRIRQEETRRLHNRYYGKTMRNAVRKLRSTTDKAEATAMYPGVTKILDKLAKTNVIHKNKANSENMITERTTEGERPVKKANPHNAVIITTARKSLTPKAFPGSHFRKNRSIIYRNPI